MRIGPEPYIGAYPGAVVHYGIYGHNGLHIAIIKAAAIVYPAAFAYDSPAAHVYVWVYDCVHAYSNVGVDICRFGIYKCDALAHEGSVYLSAQYSVAAPQILPVCYLHALYIRCVHIHHRHVLLSEAGYVALYIARVHLKALSQHAYFKAVRRGYQRILVVRKAYESGG